MQSQKHLVVGILRRFRSGLYCPSYLIYAIRFHGILLPFLATFHVVPGDVLFVIQMVLAGTMFSTCDITQSIGNWISQYN